MKKRILKRMIKEHWNDFLFASIILFIFISSIALWTNWAITSNWMFFWIYPLIVGPILGIVFGVAIGMMTMASGELLVRVFKKVTSDVKDWWADAKAEELRLKRERERREAEHFAEQQHQEKINQVYKEAHEAFSDKDLKDPEIKRPGPTHLIID